MNKMMSVASGFQYSVNIGYDLGSDEKLKNFIPTKSALELLEKILLSTLPSATDRARVLIGAYGKGKSHVVLMILSMLMKRDLQLFEKVIPKIKENPQLQQCVSNYYDSDNKILPVVISGSNTSLTQAFLLGLQRTLSENNLLDIMPDTNYQAAAKVILRWKVDFSDTFEKFRTAINEPISSFLEKLDTYDAVAYKKFEKLYPELTAGSVFNPFLGFDVVDLYENVAKGIRSKGYSGIYVVYDEFSKFLEANITEASVSDTKMLQDFAEKCNRSGSLQMHLMLISHKEISNYIDKLPQQKVDGWRGVSERFEHIHLSNNFSQTYEIISSVIQKATPQWTQFIKDHNKDFASICNRYEKHPIFSGSDEELRLAVFGCYPLHPVSTFILPRLSERIAQNERTLFTFLSAGGSSTLPNFLASHEDNRFELITPDLLYDYFEPLLKKEAYAGDIHTTYILTSAILEQLPDNQIEKKIIKTISLIYILEQFERLKPTKEELFGIYSTSYGPDEIETAINNLIEKELVIYLKRSNEYLRLKKTSGVDIKQKISDLAAAQASKLSVKEVLNCANIDNYMYPSRYNDENEMIRYFAFSFIGSDEVTENVNWRVKSENVQADGIIYGIIPKTAEAIETLHEKLVKASQQATQLIFVLPRCFSDIIPIISEFSAVSTLRDEANNDPILFDEYEVIYEDLMEIIKSFISSYTHPEQHGSFYFHDGKVVDIHRKASFSELMSTICDQVFTLTPIVNNEAVNREDITSISSNSRNKIVVALLRNELEPGLGLTGTGQEVSIMRSTLVRTGIWAESNAAPTIDLSPQDAKMKNLLRTIETFILETRKSGPTSFSLLYDKLRNAEGHIGMRKGLIPIYLAAVFHKYKQQIILSDNYGQVPVTADVLTQINSDPALFKISYMDWSPEKEDYVQRLATVFREYVVDAEKCVTSYDYVANAMRRWYMALPKYAKESKDMPDGKKIHTRYLAMTKLLRQNTGSQEMLFKRLPEAFGYSETFTSDVAEDIEAAKNCYDELLIKLEELLSQEVKQLFTLPKNQLQAQRMSLASTIKEWCDSLDSKIFEQLFTDGTDKCLNLFRTITNDEGLFIKKLARLTTDLRLEDWDNNTRRIFSSAISRYKKTAEAFHNKTAGEDFQNQIAGYQLSFSDVNGSAVTKRFEKVDISARGKLLYNQIISSIESMRHSITEQEKRQILMEVLKKLC